MAMFLWRGFWRDDGKPVRMQRDKKIVVQVRKIWSERNARDCAWTILSEQPHLTSYVLERKVIKLCGRSFSGVVAFIRQFRETYVRLQDRERQHLAQQEADDLRGDLPEVRPCGADDASSVLAQCSEQPSDPAEANDAGGAGQPRWPRLVGKEPTGDAGS